MLDRSSKSKELYKESPKASAALRLEGQRDIDNGDWAAQNARKPEKAREHPAALLYWPQMPARQLELLSARHSVRVGALGGGV
jgi:hypothetical protein